MSLVTPTLDFTAVLDEIGQTITIRTLTRTTSSDGNVTNVTTSDTDVKAVVQEVSYKEKTYLELGIVDVGDLMFFVGPSTTVTIYDKVVWNATIYSIRKVLNPPRINGSLVFKQLLCVRDSS